MFTVEKMNGVYLVMKNGSELVNAHARKRDAKAEAAFLAANTFVEKTNLISGEKYMESVDTPLCCSPSSETYWSM